MWIGGHGQWRVVEFVTPLCQLCFDRCSLESTSKHLYIRFMLHKHTEGAMWELPRHVFLLFYCRNSEKHIFPTCKCGVSPLDVSIRSCCRPDAAVARRVALIFYLHVVKFFLCPIQNVTKAQGEDWCVQEMNKKREMQRTTWNAKVVQERNSWKRRREKKIVCSDSIVEKQTRSCF